MKTSGWMLLFLGLAAVGLWSLQTTRAQTAGQGGFKVAVVNVTKVLTECQANQDRRELEKARLDKVESELKALDNEVQAIKDELQNALQPGSPEFMEKRKEWFNKQAQLQALQEYQKEVLTIDKQAWTENLYNNLLQEIASVARQQNIMLVLNKDESSNQPRNLTELLNVIVNRKVLYNAPTMDISALVLERLDQWHERTRSQNQK